MTTLLLQALLVTLGGGHAAQHPANANLYLEIPSVSAGIEAYQDAPLVLLLEDPAMQSFLGKLTGMEAEEVTIQTMTGLALNELRGELPEFGVGILNMSLEVQHASFSLSGLELDGLIPLLIENREDPNQGARTELRERILAVEGTLVLEFNHGDLAEDAHNIIAEHLYQLSEQATSSLPPIIHTEEALVDGAELTPATDIESLRLFMGLTQNEKQLTIRMSCDPILTQRDGFSRTLDEDLNYQATGKHFEGGDGTTILNTYLSLDYLDELHLVTGFVPELPEVITKVLKASTDALFPGGSIHYRAKSSLYDGEFIDEAFRAKPVGRSTNSVFSTEPLTRDSFRMVPPDAVAIWATNLNRDYITEVLTAGMELFSGEEGDELAHTLEQEFGFRPVRDLVNALGGSAVVYTMPYNSIGQPKTFLALELDNRDAFVRGLDALGRVAEKMGKGKVDVYDRPYRKQPLTVFSPGKSLMKELFATAGSVAPVFITLDLAVAVVGDRALLSTSKIYLKREVKRLLKADPGEYHAIMDEAADFPSAIQSYGQTDWGSMLSGAYASVRGFLPLIVDTGTADFPFAIEDMPASDIFSWYIKPSTTWTRELEGGTYTFSKSSFGPALPFLAGLGAGAAVVRGNRDGGNWAGGPTAVAPTLTPMASAEQLIAAIERYRTEHGSLPEQIGELMQPSKGNPDGYLEGFTLPERTTYLLDGEGGYTLKVEVHTHEHSPND